MTPRILISGFDGNRANYDNAVRQAGGEPCSFYLPPIDDSYDALLLCGGGDMLPSYFGQENDGSYDFDPVRDRVEMELTERYIRTGKPILGICRGHQLLNILLGGDILQDIGDPLNLFHKWNGADQVHPVWCTEDSFLHEIYGPVFQVNSAHHQVVNRLGSGLRAVAWSEGGLIEALEHETLPIRGTQWHPERMSYGNRRTDTVDGAPIFEWLISAVKQR